MEEEAFIPISEFERGVRENKSIAEMMIDQLVLSASRPGLTKTEAVDRRIQRDVCLPCYEIIASENPEDIAQAFYALTCALSLMALASKKPVETIDMVCNHAKEKVAASAPYHRRMMRLGITVGTKLGTRLGG